ncbi:hypothetical protein CHUAL_013283 [Chamberlinius hualienensis]
MTSTKTGIVIFFLLLLCIWSFEIGQRKNQRQSKGGIKMLFSVVEHGARTPLKFIPGNPHNKKWEKLGVGELTNIGKREQLQNGKMIRKAYNKFITPLYNSSKFFIQSSSIGRCVMSGQMLTTGLFPPKNDEVWTSSCLGREWQPIPVFTTNIASKKELIDEGLKLIKKSLTNSIIYNKYRNVLNTMSKGIKTSLSNADALYFALDALICEMYENSTLPFGLASYKNKFVPLMSDVMNYAMSHIKPKIAAIILNDVVHRIRMFNNGSSLVKTNVYILSDIHIASIMTALTNSLVGKPPFSATIFLQLHKPDDIINTDYFTVC